MTELFSSVVSGRMSTQIVAQIQAAMETGKLKKGDRLPPERVLAERFEVSRVTVRDALRALEALGLVEIRLGAAGGAFVTVPDTQIVGQGLRHLLTMSDVPQRGLAEAILSLEITTVALAAVRHDQDDLRDLEAVCNDHEAALTRGQPNIAVSSRFHSILARATRNAAIRLMTESFRGPLSMSAVSGENPSRETDWHALHDHRSLTEAIRNRDGLRAQTLMAVHLMGGVVDNEEAQGIASQMRGDYPPGSLHHDSGATRAREDSSTYTPPS